MIPALGNMAKNTAEAAERSLMLAEAQEAAVDAELEGAKETLATGKKRTKTVRDLIDKQNLKVDVEIDGGINFENCSKAKDAGANIIVSGSTVFKENKGDLKKNIEILRNN